MGSGNSKGNAEHDRVLYVKSRIYPGAKELNTPKRSQTKSNMHSYQPSGLPLDSVSHTAFAYEFKHEGKGQAKARSVPGKPRTSVTRDNLLGLPDTTADAAKEHHPSEENPPQDGLKPENEIQTYNTVDPGEIVKEVTPVEKKKSRTHPPRPTNVKPTPEEGPPLKPISSTASSVTTPKPLKPAPEKPPPDQIKIPDSPKGDARKSITETTKKSDRKTPASATTYYSYSDSKGGSGSSSYYGNTDTSKRSGKFPVYQGGPAKFNQVYCPPRSNAFFAPIIKLPEAKKQNFSANVCSSGYGNNCIEENGCLNFALRPRPDYGTEVTLQIEPRKQPVWKTMMRLGFVPIINCGVPPCQLTPKPGGNESDSDDSSSDASDSEDDTSGSYKTSTSTSKSNDNRYPFSDSWKMDLKDKEKNRKGGPFPVGGGDQAETDDENPEDMENNNL